MMTNINRCFEVWTQLMCNCEVLAASWVSEWVSSFLTAHQHIVGYSVPYNGNYDDF